MMEQVTIKEKNNQKVVYRLFKRFIDILLCTIGIVILFPVMLVSAIAILIEDGGPVFYTQLRVGENRKVFRIIKLRSMKKNAEEIHEQMKREAGGTEVSFKLKDSEDPRVLKVGHIIRKFNIDELPQMLNIIKGDMSLVGPRPLPKYEADEMDSVYGDEFNKRYSVPQGLTCYWQVSNRAEISYEDRMKLDCKYAGEACTAVDSKLVFATALYAVLGKAEY